MRKLLQIAVALLVVCSTRAAEVVVVVNEINNTTLIGHTWQLGSNAFNEALVQYSEFDNSILSDSENPNEIFPDGVCDWSKDGVGAQAPASTWQSFGT